MNTEELQFLTDYGFNIDEAIRRFNNNVALYCRCVKLFLKDDNFDKLVRAYESDDYKTILECAHSIKGSSGNLAMTKLYSDSNAIVQAVRQEEYSRLPSLKAPLVQSYTKAIEGAKLLI